MLYSTGVIRRASDHVIEIFQCLPLRFKGRLLMTAPAVASAAAASAPAVSLLFYYL